MSALSKIHDYLKAHFAGHDTETLMTHFETAIEAKVEEGLAELKQEIAELRNDLMPKPADPVTLMPADKQAEIAALPPIAQPDAVVEATTEAAK